MNRPYPRPVECDGSGVVSVNLTPGLHPNDPDADGYEDECPGCDRCRQSVELRAAA